MSNTIQLKRTSEVGKVPLLADLIVGELAFNSADNNLFISDGSAVRQINAASYLTQDSTNRLVTDAKISAWDGKQANLGYTPVNVAGDTMTGALILNGAPVASNEATTKTYVDDADSLKLDKAGDTMSGLLILSGDPVANLGAVTKQYTDNAVNAVSGKYAAPVQSFAALNALTAYEDKQIRLVEDAGALFRFDAQATDTNDGVNVLSPTDLVNPTDPGRWIKTQSATQSHNLLTNLQGGGANDYLHLTTAEKNSYDSHIVDNSLHLTSGQNSWLDAINVSSTEVNYLLGVTSSIQDQLNNKEATLGFTPVNIAGDTMSGLLILSANATAPLGAVTKQQMESFLIDGGVF